MQMSSRIFSFALDLHAHEKLALPIALTEAYSMYIRGVYIRQASNLRPDSRKKPTGKTLTSEQSQADLSNETLVF